MDVPLNVLARELFWFCLLHKITISVEWVPRESNAFVDEISKMLIPDDWSISRSFFNWLDFKWGTHTIDLFSSNENNLCSKFYSLHWWWVVVLAEKYNLLRNGQGWEGESNNNEPNSLLLPASIFSWPGEEENGIEQCPIRGVSAVELKFFLKNKMS